MEAAAAKPRHELKHMINTADHAVLSRRVRRIARPDAHLGENGTYRIKSLYFDNINDKALREKNDGLARREKFRIRYYNDDDSFVRLEKKSKIGDLCYKDSAPITREQTEKIIAGDISWMTVSDSPLIAELYAKMKFQGLKPRCIVYYVREAYTYPAGNVRITFDYDIRTGLYSTDFFNPNRPLIPVPDAPTILEVKFDEFIPSVITDIIQTNTRSASAFSKYGACRLYD